MRETKAVADLIPGDIIIPEHKRVVGYPHGVKGMPGTLVPLDRGPETLVIWTYYRDPETPFDVIT